MAEPFQWIIERKRDGAELSAEEIQRFVTGVTGGQIPEYQAAALLMAIFLKGFSGSETTALTDAMLRSGDVLPRRGGGPPRVDKHSTGGIGDKVSLILAPLLAACGCAVPMISGRGLGITGGTLDKLDSIPGYRTRLSDREISAIVDTVGCSIAGQSERLCPADRILYALRDVTATVPSIPLIVASIMSKKLAEGLDALVLDVKWGRGAFMKTQPRARELAAAMVEVGTRAGVKTRAVLTAMDQPLGASVGNWLEVVESGEALQGRWSEDLKAVTVELAAQALMLAGRVKDRLQALAAIDGAISSGRAWRVWLQMVELHGGSSDVLVHPERRGVATVVRELLAERSGWVADVDAEVLGRATLLLGVGRSRADEGVQALHGFLRIAKVGVAIQEGEPLMQIHGASEQQVEEVRQMVASVVKIVDHPLLKPTLIGEVVG